MNRNYSTEQLQRNIAHLKLVYQKEKAELEAMEANARSLEEQVEQKTAYNSQLRSRIYDNLSEIMKTSTTCSAMGKLISKASKDIEKELGKVDACDVEMVQVHNEIKAELQKTIDESQDDFINDQIQALQSQKDKLEAKLKQREIVLANLIEKNRLTKEQQKRIHEQNFEKTLDLHSKIHEIENQLLKVRYESGGLLLESVVEDDDGPINEMH